MPRIWVFLCRDRLGLSEHLSWLWWAALGKSGWSVCVDVQTGIVQTEAHPYRGQGLVGAQQRMDTLLSPGSLMQVLDALRRQKLLLQRDVRTIEEAVLRRVDAQGAWKR
jgi:hypothetical protein